MFGTKFIDRYRTYQAADQEYKALNQNIWNNKNKSDSPPPAFQPSTPRRSLHLQLKKINPDYLFWLAIPGTSINYPVVRSPRPGYYLNHTFGGTENPSGCLFIQEDTPAPGNGNTVIFGHNMKDGTMFSDLKKYKDEEYYKNHAIFYVYDKESWHKAEIFSIQIRHESDLDCYETEFHNQTEKQEFIYRMEETSIHPAAFTPSVEDPFISLSSCYGKTGRIIVQASILCYTED